MSVSINAANCSPPLTFHAQLRNIGTTLFIMNFLNSSLFFFIFPDMKANKQIVSEQGLNEQELSHREEDSELRLKDRMLLTLLHDSLLWMSVSLVM